MGRTRTLCRPVTVTLDGEALEAEEGEPLAATFLAAGKTTIARSPKFHRPRGPACFRGACDGCLARVDDNPNVMTCMLPARDGMVIVSQNRLGPRDVDLLRMTDWFFPDGMNHHELFAGVPGIQKIMQSFARRVAGLGKLPVGARAKTPRRRAERRKADIVVVGAGPAGMAAAVALSRAGRTVEVLDDQLAFGGSALALSGAEAASFDELFTKFNVALEGSVSVRLRTTAGAIYGRDLLVADDDGAEIVEANAMVFASGAHDGALAFEGNDVPGVMSARAAGWLLARGVIVGERVAVVVSRGGGPFGASFARGAAQHAKVELLYGEPIAIRGAGHVKGIDVRTAMGDVHVEADAVLIDAPRSPAYELCEQAGAKLVHDPMRGFIVQTDGGRITGGIWATGEVCGTPFDAAALEADAERVAAKILAEV